MILDKPRRKGLLRTFWWLLAGPIVVLLAVAMWAWPHLAITRTTGAKVLVVEGWMDATAMREAAQLIADSGYTRIYTTGSVRPFAYLLGKGQGIGVDFNDPLSGTLLMEAVGLPGSGLCLVAGSDTILNEQVTAEMVLFKAAMPRTEHLQLLVYGGVAGPAPGVFVRSLTLDGMNLNYLQSRSWFIHRDDASEPAWPTYAQSARQELIGLGVPADRIVAVPAYGKPGSRSWGNAHAFGIRARTDGITAFDIATVGVHARRSRNLFQLAVGNDVQVGVVALNDPWCGRDNWWKSYRGWYTLLKEVVGASEPDVVEIKRWGATSWNREGPGPAAHGRTIARVPEQ